MSKLEPKWRRLSAVLATKIPPHWRSWLSYTDSMTERLQNYCNKVTISVLSQVWQCPFVSERKVLCLAESELALIREVRILCDEEPWLFARTVIPSGTLTATGGKLAKLGTTPIGNFLFAEKTMQRGRFEVAKVKPGDYFFYRANGDELTTKYLWARRSVFYINKQPLLINEVFTSRCIACAPS
jgi:chorismate--pyruvate lyase